VIFSAPFAFLLLGLAVIVWGTKIVLDNAVVVARHHGVSDFFVGVVVLAIGSDLPELAVTIHAAIKAIAGQDTAGLIVGNAIGSCFGQLGLVVGLGGLVGRLHMNRTAVLQHGSVLLAATGLLALVGFDGTVTRWEGSSLVIGFSAYLYWVLRQERRAAAVAGPGGNRTPVIAAHWLRLAVGIALVVFSAELIVRMAMTLALQWGVEQSFIGIAIVGVGTSLPEVVISIAAIVRGRIGMSVGNLIGSNVLDTLLPVGIAAVLAPLHFDAGLLFFDLPMLASLTVLVLVFLFLRNGVRWPQAAVVLAAYGSYLVSIGKAL
jgi:cation:H+ antiporter